MNPTGDALGLAQEDTWEDPWRGGSPEGDLRRQRLRRYFGQSDVALLPPDAQYREQMLNRQSGRLPKWIRSASKAMGGRRTCSWFGAYRRLSQVYEHRFETSKAMVRLGRADLMLRRIP